MSTKISKILTVFVTVASVAFMAVIIANVKAGGPNWKAKATELPEVAFEPTGPESPWTAKRRTDNADMGGGAILPEAIVKAQKKLIETERTAQTDLDAKIAAIKSKTVEATAQIVADLDALKRRQADLEAQYKAVRDELEKLSEDYTTEAKKQIDDLDLLKLRKEEYIRVKNQLEELRAQREVASDDLDRLRALLYQAQSNLDRVRKRQQTLAEDGAQVNYDENAEPAKGTEAKPEEPKAKPEKPEPEKTEN